MLFSLFVLILATSQRKFTYSTFRLGAFCTFIFKRNAAQLTFTYYYMLPCLRIRSPKFIQSPYSKKRIWKPSSTQKNGPTRVTQSSSLPSHNKLESRSSSKHTRRADWYKQDRIYAALGDCLSGIQKHVNSIKQISSGGVNSENAQEVAWAFLRELKEILNLINECLRRIKHGDFPLPSAKPGFFGHASIIDICRVIADILTEIRDCFQTVSDASKYFPIIQNICGDTLNQISGGVANLIIASSGQLGGIIRFIARLFSGTPGFFNSVGFGFGNIPGILAGSGGSRELERFM
ncbi:hypothetical protein MJO28_009816 [Puccinia striiformis f. sp. tritici]|uniref:Uncharacterized protein n=3 Tax=Puccinia striiformis TaxID=27350 RepID=A0A2S4WEN7_9BASI|nr:hypothetical protein MJO28_009816 [Puccinia striiformis f. sp. tritici]KAI7950908.1 hypothetical protein MJO29_009582 [Puccinia striiformis f. sp. tritici]POW07987.1 hypothetical protein PSTT_07885 [Puccinia striiformis]POW20245.1 hypothetical protein PSHT_03773 [Puccinia striiformis]